MSNLNLNPFISRLRIPTSTVCPRFTSAVRALSTDGFEPGAKTMEPREAGESLAQAPSAGSCQRMQVESMYGLDQAQADPDESNDADQVQRHSVDVIQGSGLAQRPRTPSEMDNNARPHQPNDIESFGGSQPAEIPLTFRSCKQRHRSHSSVRAEGLY